MSEYTDSENLEEIRVSTTDPKFGTPPGERTISQLLERGAVILDKPHGPTSHQVAHWLKDILNLEKAGHHGTLDPNTTGVLSIALSHGVKALEATSEDSKEYIAVMKLHRDVDRKVVEELAAEFTGEIYQMVPVRSAVKRGLRTRKIHYIKVLEKEGQEVLLLVGSQSGTYIRTLIHDMGEVLGVGASMAELRRTRSGPIREELAVTLQQVKDGWELYKDGGDEKILRDVIHPFEILLGNVKKVAVKDSAVDALCHGAMLGHPGVAACAENIQRGDRVAIMTLKGEAVALGTAKASSKEMMVGRSGVASSVDRVLMDTSTYPRAWKSHR